MKEHDPVGTGIVSVFARVIRVFGGQAALAALIVFTTSDGIRAPLVPLIQAASADEQEYDSKQEAEEVVEIESIVTEEDDYLNQPAEESHEDAAEVAATMDPSYESEEEAEDIGEPSILTEDDDVEPAVDSDPPSNDEHN